MCENGRRNVGDAGRLLPCRAAAEARTVDHQERRLLARSEATVLATAKNVCLVTGALRHEAGAGHTVFIGLIARAHRNRKSEAVIPTLPHRRQRASVKDGFRPFLIGEKVADERRAATKSGWT